VAGTAVFSYRETEEAHARVTRTLEFELRLTSFRVWIQRGSNEVLGSLLGLDPSEPGLLEADRVRARADVAAIRESVAGDSTQLARVDELAGLLERRIALEAAARAAFRESGPQGAAALLAGSDWMLDRLRIRTITGAMLDTARQEFARRDADYASTMRRVRGVLLLLVLLMLGTLLYLQRQLRVAQRSREEAVRANDLASVRLADLEAVLDTVPAAVFIAHDPGCQDIRGNGFAEVLFRAPPGSNLSLSAPEGTRIRGMRFLRGGVELPAEELPLHRAARTGEKVETVQLDLVFDDGRLHHVLATAHPLRDPSGAVRGAVGAYVDVSDVVRVAHELRAALGRNKELLASARRNELLYRAMARSFPNGAIALYDHDLRFLIFDGTRFAISRDAASNVGRTLAEIFPRDVAARIEPVHREALQGRQGQLETVINGRNIEICTSPVRDDTGAVVMGIATSQDVTEERALRTQLALSSRLASLGTLVAGVAHEVNNPLAGTLGSLATAIEDSRAIIASVRDEGPLDGERLVRAVEDVVEILLDAQVGGNRIARIVKDLALFGRPNPLRTRVRLGDVVTSSMRWLPASVGRNATVRVDDLGAPDVHASAGQLEQVVVNLVANAAFAIPEGRRGEIDVRITTSDEGRAVLEVQDDGKGIDPATMERIFDPFFTTRDVGHGMGLGLPICHAIVTAHGGALTASSVPDKGSTFRVELPTADTHQGAIPIGSRV
jgi:signal transduction histidine kinase